jgi:ATPase involved in DNA repair/ATPase family associated with various cellular activities (AAA)
MATESKPAQPADSTLEGGSYEVLRERLGAHAKALVEKAESLNTRRKKDFGGQESAVLGNERIRTEHSCMPRDVVQVGAYLLHGFNAFLGLKQDKTPRDFFTLHHFKKTDDGFDFTEAGHNEAGGFLDDRRLVKDLSELTRYYKDARLMRLVVQDEKLLAVFATGTTERDVKVFRFSLDRGGGATYLDLKGAEEVKVAPTHDFGWTRLGREHQVQGKHPHVNVLDECFLETVGGDLTIKVENNTQSGAGIYSEPVLEADQSLDDAEFSYAKLGALILLKVLPFREEQHRYLVFNTRSRQVVRADAIGTACMQLPEEQGVIFPGGFALQTGEVKVFDPNPGDLLFDRALHSPNGEDVLYVFHARWTGKYVLLGYNLVRKEVATPVHCLGWAQYSDGRIVVLRAESDEPSRVHPVQVWQTPFVSAEHHAAAPKGQGFLAKVGNADLVRGISEALTLARMAKAESPTRRSWEDLLGACTRVTDSYYWLGHQEVELAAPIGEVKRTAELILGEFEKVQALKRRAEEEMAKAQTSQDALMTRVAPHGLTTADAFLVALVDLRAQRGQLITAREIRYVDRQKLEAMEAQVAASFEEVSKACVAFLLQPAALEPVLADIARRQALAEKVDRYADAEPLVKELEKLGSGLELLGEVVGGLKAGDPSEKATILEAISGVFAQLNRARATAQNRRKELLGKERRAEFGAQFKLFAQAIESALSLADSPEKCDEQLARLGVQLEELESRFAELDEFHAQLAERREEMLEGFEARKQALLDERNRRAANLMSAAERILQGLARRAKSFTAEDELNSFFAADPMVDKLRDLVTQLHGVKDPVKADEVESRLKAAKQDALRALRDKADLYEDGEAVLKFGTHRFNVNTQAIELTVLPKDGQLYLSLTGTDFLQPIDDPELEKSRHVWDMTLPSESREVYRAESLAAAILFDSEVGKNGHSLDRLRQAALEPGGLLAITKARAQERYDEGYERGVHDADAALLLGKTLELRDAAGLLRYGPKPRAFAALYWGELKDEAARRMLHQRAVSLGSLRETLGPSGEAAVLGKELEDRIAEFLGWARVEADAVDVALAARYLVDELAQAEPRFVLGREAVVLRQALRDHLERSGARQTFESALAALADRPGDRYRLALAWLEGSVAARADLPAATAQALPEAAALLAIDEALLSREESTAPVAVELTGLLGQHPRVVNGVLSLKLDEFVTRLSHFRSEVGPAYTAFRSKVRGLLEAERRRLRLEELQPKVLTSFVRNRLIDEVYLPLIGTNLAKQLGSAGENKRTDRMGLLLLISPPGYGKTTLMEYVASRLGLAFVKVNGPSLGHDVVSVDPAQAPNATARQEVERINFAFELGNNVMLYLDDVQHTNPELLQKFISLCDGSRRVEGVWNGRTRTYDFRGKKFCVVMAGNPYTETGERFRIPDMLANRADTYNLGDILGGKEDLFALSYIENALTSNTALAPLATRPTADVHKIIEMAKSGGGDPGQLSQSYSAVELQEMTAVLSRLFKVQETLLRVNQQYIASASQDDRFRTEPPFKLQGSYRNMNKMAEKVVAALSDEELQRLLDGHYQSESQTLTTAAEANLLKLAEMRGRQTPQQKERWDELKRGYKRIQTMGGAESDPVVRVTGTLATLGSNLEAIRDAVTTAAARPYPSPPDFQPVLAELDELKRVIAAAAARPVPPPPDLRPVLEKMTQLASRPPPPPPDFEPLLEKLAALASRPVPPPPDLRPVLEKMTQLASRPPPPPPDLEPILEKMTALAARPAPATQDLGPILEKVTQLAARAPAAQIATQANIDLSPVLEKLAEVAASNNRAPPPIDLGPVLEQLTRVVASMAQARTAPAPAASADLGPVMDRMASAITSLAERSGTIVPPNMTPRAGKGVPAEVERQLVVLRDTLAPLARAARETLQASPDGELKAVQVWQQVSQALELLKAISVPKAPSRKGHAHSTER